MRISDPPTQAGGLNFLSMSKHGVELDTNRKNYFKDRSRYIHRCPFSHCPHQEMLNSHVECTPLSIKVSLDSFDTSSSYENDWAEIKQGDDLRQGRFIARGAAYPFITSQDRQRAILYMLKRMKIKRKNLNENIQSRLLASILALEKQVFLDSDTKEKYTENLATKLFLISQELEKRKNMTARRGPSLYADISSSLQSKPAFKE